LCSGVVRERVLARGEGRRRILPIDSGLCFSTIARPRRRTTSTTLVAALERSGSARAVLRRARPRPAGDLDRHAPALQAADEQLLVRETIRGRRARHGLVASLAPKPWPDNAGNGGHVHFSLWDGERNRFYDAARRRPLGDARVVRRRRPRAPARALRARPRRASTRTTGSCRSTGPARSRCWGFDNREAPVRVASPFRGAEEASTNAELKACDASCNPYLALGGLIAAGLDGLERGLEPPEPVDVDPATDPPRTSARSAGSVPLPSTQEKALDALAADERLTSALGPTLTESYLAVRRSEWAAYVSGDLDIQCSRVISRSNEAGSDRRPPRSRIHGVLRARASTSSADIFFREPDRGSGLTSRPG
jgi:glutamine synthetase